MLPSGVVSHWKAVAIGANAGKKSKYILYWTKGFFHFSLSQHYGNFFHGYDCCCCDLWLLVVHTWLVSVIRLCICFHSSIFSIFMDNCWLAWLIMFSNFSRPHKCTLGCLFWKAQAMAALEQKYSDSMGEEEGASLALEVVLYTVRMLLLWGRMMRWMKPSRNIFLILLDGSR